MQPVTGAVAGGTVREPAFDWSVRKTGLFVAT